MVTHRRERKFIPPTITIATALGIVVAVAIYVARVPRDPPGFYIDESSIAYNAYTISQTGRDEHGVPWPLYFQAFGEFKNPTFVYLLAAVFKVTGPSIRAARLLSALSGLVAALLLGLLAWKLSGKHLVAIIVGCSAVLTPWLYESSRLVFEVAAYPLATVLFLLALRRAASRPLWKASDVFLITAGLALMTYTYSIGRLLGPMFALGLLLFAQKGNRRAVGLALSAYALALVPILVFPLRHPGALTARLNGITYLSPNNSLASTTFEFIKHYLADISPWTMLVTGEQNPRDHIGGTGSLLFATFVVAVAGLLIVVKYHRQEPWWRFIVYTLIASVVPAALTVNDFPQLRLVVFPVLLHVLMVPALARLSNMKQLSNEKRAEAGWRSAIHPTLLVAIVALIICQGAYFQILFHRESPARWYFMDARFARKIFEPALALNRRPIYLFDPPGQSGYIQALWYGTLRGIAHSEFVRLGTIEFAPADRVVISTERRCNNCRLIARSLNYIAYVVLPSHAHAEVLPLAPEGFRAQVSLRQTPATFAPGQKHQLRVSLKNVSNMSWPCVGDEMGRYAVEVRARWRRPDGSLVSDAGKSDLDYDLEPGDVSDLDLQVTMPASPGEYILDIDLFQEPDRWFAENGSTPLRLPIRVSPAPALTQCDEPLPRRK